MDRLTKPKKGKVEAKRARTRTPPKDDSAKVRDLEKRLAESLEREKAAGEILRVISSSPASVQPTFEAIARAAMSLCEADIGSLFRFDGQLIHVGAFHGTPAETEASRRAFPQRPSHRSVTARAILAATVVQIDDVSKDPEAADALRAFRTVLSVPMIRDGRPLGAITVARRVVRPFSDEQIELVKTFADQAVIAIENVRLFEELQTRNSELTESLDQHTATSEILRVISSSPTDGRPVFDVIAQNAMRLCAGSFCAVSQYDGEVLHLAAHAHVTAEGIESMKQLFPLRPSRATVAGRVVIGGTVVHLPDVQTDPEYLQPFAEALRAQSGLGVPMLRDSATVGAIVVGRFEARPFTEREITLLQTFADQAMIAIENVRLFTELQTSNRDLTTALDTQTATADILRVISGSRTDVQPVFDTIIGSAVRLLRGYYGSVTRVVGDQIELAAYNFSAGIEDARVAAYFPRPLHSDSVHAQAIRDRGPVNIADAQIDPVLSDLLREVAHARGYRGLVTVPLLRQNEAIGTIAVARREAGGFTDDEIALLKTFADQAVIAIENVRLFTELQASNRELTTALGKQTATSDILAVISRSQTDVQPVFDAIIVSAVRLLGADHGALTRVVRDQLEHAASTFTTGAGDPAVRAAFPRPLQAEGLHAQAIRDRAPVNIADVETDPGVSEELRAVARARGYRSVAAVPLLRHDEAIGTIAVARYEAGRFTDDEVALLQTFADQAVIAIENVRLFKELEERTTDLTRSVGELRALGEVGQAISSTLDLQTVLSTIVARATQLSGTDAGVIYEYDEGREVFLPRATERLEAEIVETMLATPVRKGEGATGQLAEIQEPVQVPDILTAPAESRVRSALVRAGYRALLAVPLVREDHLLGGLTVIRKSPGTLAPGAIELLQTFATQSSLAIQNARLFREIEIKSRELEVASQHKSEFLANMSHELRTPLNAIIGYSELLEEDAADLAGGRLVPDLQKIATAAKHQLSLINDILDLSKVEAGRMELDLSEFDLPHAIENALILVRERASRRGIRLGSTIDERLGVIGGDERKVKQVLLNLLSNALKFTPEGGRIDVRAGVQDEVAEVSVTDTGVGIASEDQEAVFEEFRQVGTADKKVEGTGLGLALCRKFVELHGGRIWVKSELGQGSTFTFALPVRRGG